MVGYPLANNGKGQIAFWKNGYLGNQYNSSGFVANAKANFNASLSTGKNAAYSSYFLNIIGGGFLAYDAMANPQYGQGFGGKYNEGIADGVGWGLGFSSTLFPISMTYFKVKQTLKISNGDQIGKASLYTGYRSIPRGFGPKEYEELDRILDSMWNEKTKRGQTRSATW